MDNLDKQTTVEAVEDVNKVVATLVSNFAAYTSGGGSWQYIEGVTDEGGLKLSGEVCGDFHIYDYIREVYDIDLNCVTAGSFVDRYLSEEDLLEAVEGAPTGFLDVVEVGGVALVGDGQVIRVTGDRQSLGRNSKQSDYKVHGSGLSRVHAYFYEENGHYYVEDNGSLNGTFVNGVRLKSGEVREVVVGDRVVFVATEFTVCDI